MDSHSGRPGNSIRDGGHVVGPITEVMNPTTVIVTVTSTSVPSVVPAGPVRGGHDVKYHALATLVGKLNGTPFCGTGAPAGYCGA